MAKRKAADETAEPASEPTTPAAETSISFTADEWALIEGALLGSRAFGALATEDQAALLQKVRDAKANA
jgi:hypothetical protein